MSKLIPILPRLEIECWILDVQMSSYWVSLTVVAGFRDCGNACGTLQQPKVTQASSLEKNASKMLAVLCNSPK